MVPTNIKAPTAKIVVVLPCYNEARRLDTQAIESFLRQSPDVVFLFVDDGSTDDTPLVLEQLRQRAPAQVCTLRLSSNRGKAEAVRTGISVALRRRAEIVGFWDADLATPLAMIPQLVEVLRTRSHVQLAMGSRVAMLGRQISRKPWRHFLGRVFATATSMILRLPVYDSQCGAKLLRVTSRTAVLFSEPFRARWIFDVELLVRIASQTVVDSNSANSEALFYEHPVDSWREVDGSNVRLVDFITAATDLIAIYWRYMRAGGRSKSRSRTSDKLNRPAADQRAAA